MFIAIVNNTDGIINYDSLETGCGGSETWALQLSKAFVERCHTVTIFTTTNEEKPEKLYLNKVNIVPFNYIQEYWASYTYDFMIVSRIMTPNIQYCLKQFPKVSKYIFYQFHDLYAGESNISESIKMINKIIALTPYHAKYLHKMENINYYKFSIIPNGVDLSLFNNLKEPEKRNNRLLWCSNPDRGLYLILKYLYDDIKKEIPDFGIDIVYPNYSTLNLLETDKNKDIRILGSLNKENLYKEMIKHKCWCYPQNFIDTFCISMLEAALCNVNIVCPWWYGPGDIFGDLIDKDSKYDKIIVDEYNKIFYSTNIKTETPDDFHKYLGWLKNQIIDAIKNYDSEQYRVRREMMFNRVIKNYTWNNVAALYESLYINEKVQHNDYEQ